MFPAIHFVTYHTSNEKSKYLYDSAAFHKIEIKNLARSDHWVGLRDKLIGLRDFVTTLPSDDIVCFLDAYDGIVNASKDEFMTKFLETKTEIIFGAEINLHPDSLHSLAYPESSTAMRYLNSGFYIGYVRALQKFVGNKRFEEFDKDYNDQEYFNRYYIENYQKENIKLDTQCDFVINMNKVPWNSLQTHSGLVHTTFQDLNKRPLFIHFNGMSYLDVDKDCVRNGNTVSFNYHQMYHRTFFAIINSKILTSRCDVVCLLTGRGMTY
jgi:hypothetical protein